MAMLSRLKQRINFKSTKILAVISAAGVINADRTVKCHNRCDNKIISAVHNK